MQLNSKTFLQFFSPFFHHYQLLFIYHVIPFSTISPQSSTSFLDESRYHYCNQHGEREHPCCSTSTASTTLTTTPFGSLASPTKSPHSNPLIAPQVPSHAEAKHVLLSHCSDAWTCCLCVFLHHQTCFHWVTKHHCQRVNIPLSKWSHASRTKLIFTPVWDF